MSFENFFVFYLFEVSLFENVLTISEATLFWFPGTWYDNHIIVILFILSFHPFLSALGQPSESTVTLSPESVIICFKNGLKWKEDTIFVMKTTSIILKMITFQFWSEYNAATLSKKAVSAFQISYKLLSFTLKDSWRN